MLPGWLGSVLSGTLGGTSANPSIGNVQLSPPKDKSEETRFQESPLGFEELLDKDMLPEVNIQKYRNDFIYKIILLNRNPYVTYLYAILL